MDDHYCRYGFLTTYEYTWFVKRQDDTHFLMSPPISATAQSSTYGVSLRECLFATAIRAADDKESDYGFRCGLHSSIRTFFDRTVLAQGKKEATVNRVA
ncbi:similar to An11g05890 [Aspergillus luchuensis]|uniref:Similar to An11g05890 n=1 Tax=Aspergillus kawachii TaxID=1069201 RepID=A0A146FGH4_ASPKA|nr:similar to An11g05890 [Aspergillus luchuensis]